MAANRRSLCPQGAETLMTIDIEKNVTAKREGGNTGSRQSKALRQRKDSLGPQTGLTQCRGKPAPCHSGAPE